MYDDIMYVCMRTCPMILFLLSCIAAHYCLHNSDDLSREIDSLREEIDENVTRQRNLEAEVYELREKKV